jgi:hypothetical protein
MSLVQWGHKAEHEKSETRGAAVPFSHRDKLSSELPSSSPIRQFQQLNFTLPVNMEKASLQGRGPTSDLSQLDDGAIDRLIVDSYSRPHKFVLKYIMTPSANHPIR